MSLFCQNARHYESEESRRVPSAAAKGGEAVRTPHPGILRPSMYPKTSLLYTRIQLSWTNLVNVSLKLSSKTRSDLS